MFNIKSEKRNVPETTVVESSTKSWLILIVYVALTLFLARVAWRQIGAILSRGSSLDLRSADLMTLLTLALCGLLIFRIFQSMKNFYNSLRLDLSGEMCAAVVIEKWHRKSDGDQETWITIEYGDGYSAKARLNYRGFQNFKVGGDLLVEYLPERPEVVRIKSR